MLRTRACAVLWADERRIVAAISTATLPATKLLPLGHLPISSSRTSTTCITGPEGAAGMRARRFKRDAAGADEGGRAMVAMADTNWRRRS